MSFRVALSGLNAASSQLDVTANNIANVNTTGFKSSRASFADVFATANNDVSSTTAGGGVRLAGISQLFSQGTVDITNNNLDLALSGNGFFTLKSDNGVSYTRAGSFSVDREGYVVNASNERLQVFAPSVDGSYNTSAYGDLQLQVSESAPNATSSGDIAVNLPADADVPTIATFDPTVSSSYNHATSMTIFDSLGATHTATMYFVKDATANNWGQHLFVDGNAVGTANTLTFDSLGNLQTPADGVIDFPSYDPGTGAAALDLSFDLSDTTQFGSDFSVNNLQQDGYTTGSLTGIDVAATGEISAYFSNGQSTQLGKIAMANFTNPNGLQQQGDASWRETFSSGSARFGEAGTSNLGVLQSGALEGSNVDLTEQLVEMITAQRNFQANTKMISVADEITQSIINMR